MVLLKCLSRNGSVPTLGNFSRAWHEGLRGDRRLSGSRATGAMSRAGCDRGGRAASCWHQDPEPDHRSPPWGNPDHHFGFASSKSHHDHDCAWTRRSPNWARSARTIARVVAHMSARSPVDTRTSSNGPSRYISTTVPTLPSERDAFGEQKPTKSGGVPRMHRIPTRVAAPIMTATVRSISSSSE